MKKLFTVLFLLIATSVFAAPPSRVSTYTAGSIITSSSVTQNEDALFNYLQGGVDTYVDASIFGSDISSVANIQSNSINFSSIAQDVGITSAGSLTNGGATTLNGAVTLGDAIADTLVIDAGAWTLTNATTFTLTGALTFSGTIANLGTVTTADINGGTLDEVQIGGTTATGELIVNNATDDADGLGSQGTAGQVLKSAGAGVNPTWADMFTIRDDTGLSAVIATAPTTRTSTSKSLVKLKEIENWVLTGTVSVSWLMKASGGLTSTAFVYVNGLEVGSEQTTTSATDVVKSSSGINVVSGDKIQIYGKISAGTVDIITVSSMKVHGAFASETSGY
jgi:hypothetical protein